VASRRSNGQTTAPLGVVSHPEVRPRWTSHTAARRGQRLDRLRVLGARDAAFASVGQCACLKSQCSKTDAPEHPQLAEPGFPRVAAARPSNLNECSPATNSARRLAVADPKQKSDQRDLEP